MTHIFFGSIKNGGILFNYRKVANNSTSFKTMQCVRNDVKLEKIICHLDLCYFRELSLMHLSVQKKRPYV